MMGISENQLDIWSKQGAISGSSDTYNAVKSVLQAKDSYYTNKNFTVYLQGSYGNSTNIYSESDVDIIIQLKSIYKYDLDLLTPEQKIVFQQQISGTIDYDLPDFKREVFANLITKYGNDAVMYGSKAFSVAANSSRRKTDVVVCMDFRRYYSEFNYIEGICFFDANNNLIINYPKLHSENVTKKHQNTYQLYKPMVRIFKNMRNVMISNGVLKAGDAPSYFIEGMLYNVPNIKFERSLRNTMISSLNWLKDEAERNNLLCANEQYYLLHDSSPVTWRSSKYEIFIQAAFDLWQQW